MALSKYLDRAGIDKYFGTINVDPTFSPMSQDSYNERAIIKAILDTGRAPELLYSGINMGVVGYGSKRFGNFKLQDKLVEIVLILQECNVKLNIGKDARLLDSDLTPGRICRAFRYHIRDYIKAQHIESYMYRKYSDRNPAFMSVMFRGSEYLDDLTKEECTAILEAHARLDAKCGTNMVDRIERIFAAKGAAKQIV